MISYSRRTKYLPDYNEGLRVCTALHSWYFHYKMLFPFNAFLLTEKCYKYDCIPLR